MNAPELKELFNVLYNNALAGAPGLDNFEISSYLTLSQEDTVKKAYLASNDHTGSFESREYNRRLLNELVVDEKITSSITSTRGLVDDSKFFELGGNAIFIVIETVQLSAPGSVLNNKLIEVKPVTHDEFMKSYKSPFRKPNGNKAWRLDLEKENSKTTVEIVSPYDIVRYNVRYVRFPDPIIVSDLITDEEVGGLGLTINGSSALATCKLNEIIHRDIVEEAVDLAVRDYREGRERSRFHNEHRQHRK